MPAAEFGASRATYQHGPVTGMGLVTGLAGSALKFLVDMDVVQIAVTVPEFCGSGGLFFRQQFTVMTFKTKAVFFEVIRGIEAGYHWRGEQLFIIRAVRVMAAGASAFSDGAVQICLPFQLAGNIRGPKSGDIRSTPVAAQTKCLFLFN